MNENFEFYEKLIQNEQHLYGKLWDLVIITAINKQQKLCYEKQIKNKLVKSKLPKQFQYKIINDPCNCKIGSGGSTLNVIRQLFDTYRENLYKMKVLLIHAGGYSQRMPSCSALGKIFYPLPCKSAFINDMLDMKLAIYTPFSVDMSPGMFLTSSDDIESFYLNEQLNASKLFNSKQVDFVLIAHRSSLDIGKDHGCYGLGSKHTLSTQFEPTEINECEIVLQKPKIDDMRKAGIVKTVDSEEYVYTDSVFYFTHTVVRELLAYSSQYYSDLIKLNIELDAYKDFLQPLGTRRLGLDQYMTQTRSNFDAKNTNQKWMFEDLYTVLSHKRACVLTLRDSNFYHLGTINELFDLYLNEKNQNSLEFRRLICFERNKNAQAPLLMATNDRPFLLSSVISGENVVIQPNCLLEFCIFSLTNVSSRLEINENCYLSNCHLNQTSTVGQIRVPSNICMHTVAINEKSSIKYVTIGFSRLDDLKKAYSTIESVLFLGRPLGCQVEITGTANTIWNLKVFSSASTMSDSFVECTELINSVLDNRLDEYFSDRHSNNFYSLFDLLNVCNYDEMIRSRNHD